MGISKVDFNGKNLIDVSKDTVTPDVLLKGRTAHNANGERIVGTMVSGEGGGGSGIITVSELPEDGIDENAVYKVDSQLLLTPADMWVVNGNQLYSMTKVLTNQGMAVTIYIVDELPTNPLPTDTVTVVNCYILDSTGIGYVNVPGMGWLPAGMLVFEATGFDKGWTDDPKAIDGTNPSNIGLYSTRPVYKQVIRWYVRTNFEWEEVSATVNMEGIPEVLSGEYPVEELEITQNGIEVNVAEQISENKTIPHIIVNTPSWIEAIGRTLTKVSPEMFVEGTRTGYLRDYSFAGCGWLKEANLPDGWYEIPPHCFHGCYSMESIQMPNSIPAIRNNAFEGCESLNLTTLPQELQIIGNEAFKGCTSLALTSLPTSMKSIGSGAFYDCKNLALTELELYNESATNAYIDMDTFYGCENMPLERINVYNLKRIGNNAFYGCKQLALTELPDSIIRIQSYAFTSCENLAISKLPQSLQYVEDGAFYNCNSLVEIVFDMYIRSIGGFIFGNCQNLTTITINIKDVDAGKLSIASNAFINCPNLKTINLRCVEANAPEGAPWGATNATINYGVR